jgi:hypothetical protein
MAKITNLEVARLATTARPADCHGRSAVGPSGLGLAAPSNRLSDAHGREKLEQLQDTSNNWSYGISQTSGLFDKDRNRLAKRQNVIRELIDTELIFVRDMSLVRDVYKQRASLGKETAGKIFRNTDEIIQLHTTILSQLFATTGSANLIDRDRPSLGGDRVPAGTRNAPDRSIAIGAVLEDNILRLREIHGEYLRGSSEASRKLMELQQGPRGRAWLDECRGAMERLTNAFDLDSLLIKPLQRITKYPLLVSALLQHTPADHPDRPSLLKAKEALESTLGQINRTIHPASQGPKPMKAAPVLGRRLDRHPGVTPLPQDLVLEDLQKEFYQDQARLRSILHHADSYVEQMKSSIRQLLCYTYSIELFVLCVDGPPSKPNNRRVECARSIQAVAQTTLADHVAQVRKRLIAPLEQVLEAYRNPTSAIAKREMQTRRIEDMQRWRLAGNVNRDGLRRQVQSYEALSQALREDLLKRAVLTRKMVTICLDCFITTQMQWYSTWRDKLGMVLSQTPEALEGQDIVGTFKEDFDAIEEQVAKFGFGRAPTGRQCMPSDGETLRSRARATVDGSVHDSSLGHCVPLATKGQPSAFRHPPEVGRIDNYPHVVDEGLASESTTIPWPDGEVSVSVSSLVHRQSARTLPQSLDLSDAGILWQAVSLFEFNVFTTKQEAGYPYLHYAAGQVCAQLTFVAVANDDLIRSLMWWAKQMSYGSPSVEMAVARQCLAGYGQNTSPG